MKTTLKQAADALNKAIEVMRAAGYQAGDAAYEEAMKAMTTAYGDAANKKEARMFAALQKTAIQSE